MKDLLIMFVEFFFEVDSNNDYSPKKLLKVVLKILLIIIILIIILYFMLGNSESITISR